MANPTLAERYRAHREAFNYALANNITPREAEAKLARDRAAARHGEAMQRLKRVQAGQPATAPILSSVSSQQAFENSQRLLGERETEPVAPDWTPEP